MIVLAEFVSPRRMVEAARAASRRHYRVLDGFSPYPVEGLAELFHHRPGRVRTAMFAGGMIMAALAYGLEYFSAVINYPYNSGGRQLDAWPAFMLVPFATGILVASISGVVSFLRETGLPRLHHPLFAAAGFERVSQDTFMLALEPPATTDEMQEIVDWLHAAGAVAIREVDA